MAMEHDPSRKVGGGCHSNSSLFSLATYYPQISRGVFHGCRWPAGGCAGTSRCNGHSYCEDSSAQPRIEGNCSEVVMVLNTPYDLLIPANSTASLSPAGVLGEILVEIDARHASGPTIGSNAVLALPVKRATTQTIIKNLKAIVGNKDCNGNSDGNTPCPRGVQQS
jgi:hypothetical protein